MRTITHPVRRALSVGLSYVNDELELQANSIQFLAEVQSRRLRQQEDLIVKLMDKIDDLTDQIDELNNLVVDTRNEEAIRESNVLGIEEDSAACEALDLDNRVEKLESMIMDDDVIGEIMSDFLNGANLSIEIDY